VAEICHACAYRCMTTSEDWRLIGGMSPALSGEFLNAIFRCLTYIEAKRLAVDSHEPGLALNCKHLLLHTNLLRQWTIKADMAASPVQ